MRTIALTWCFLLLPAPVLAQEGCGDGCGCGEAAAEETEHDISPPADLKAQEIVDKAGNFKIKTLDGWEIVREAPEDKETNIRLILARKDSYGNQIITMYIIRNTTSRGETFTIDTPGDVLGQFLKSGSFDDTYGQGAGDVLRPRVNEGVQLGGATKSGEYELNSITMEEDEEIREKEALKRRDPKTVVPEFKPRIIRGRLALVSPFIYLIRAHFARQLNHRPELAEEYQKVVDSFEFLEAGEMPPPLTIGGAQFTDTVTDPANADERKQEVMMVVTGRKPYKLRINFVVPTGFVRLEKLESHTAGGTNVGGRAVMIAAQDARNNWCQIEVIVTSARAAGDAGGDLRDKKEFFEEWATNWESKARGVKVPRKPKGVRIGRWSGKGYDMLEGTVANFPGTFTAAVNEKSGWRTRILIETRGEGHEVFKDHIKTFGKSLKLRPMK